MADEILIALRVLDDITAPLQGIGSSLGNFGNILTGIKSGLDLLGDAWDFATDQIQPFIDSASEAETALVGLENVLRSTNGQAGITEEQLLGIANALQLTTQYSDEQVMAAEAMLLRFENINQNIFPEAIRLTTDLAASLGIDLTTAARQIGMALDDPASGIGRLNTQFRLFNDTEMETIRNMAENGQVAEAQALIMERLREKVGGAAEAFGDTFAGSLTITQNRLDEMRETIGGALLPILQRGLDIVGLWIPDLEILANSIADFIGGLDTTLLENFVNDLGSVGFTQAFSNLIDNIDWEQLSRDFVDGLNSINWDAVSQGAGGLSNAFTSILIGIDWSAVAGAIWESLIQAFMVVIDNGADALIRLLADVFGDPDVATFQAGVQAGGERLAQILLGALFPATIGIQLRERMLDIAGDMIDGLWDGWDNTLRSIGAGGIANWWSEHIVEPIKDFLGIHSPSTLFMGIGRDIILGLISGINSMLSGLQATVSNVLSIINPFDNGSSTGGRLGTGLDPRDTGGYSLGGGLASGGYSLGGGLASGGSSGNVVNNYYGPVYFQGAGEPGSYYDCPSPNPIITGTSTGGGLSSRNGGR